MPLFSFIVGRMRQDASTTVEVEFNPKVLQSLSALFLWQPKPKKAKPEKRKKEEPREEPKEEKKKPKKSAAGEYSFQVIE